jgi:signal transduction histidine kinase
MQVLAVDAGVDMRIGSVDGVVHADPDRAVQTLINLIGNALKFSYPGGEVEISAWPADDVIEFSVTDQGRGIPDDRLERIFNRFEQVDSSDAREKGGFGLGLAISRSLVERSGGRIWATNNADRGATLHFTLPRATDCPLETADIAENAEIAEATADPARNDTVVVQPVPAPAGA